MSAPGDSQDQLRRIEARLVGLRKNAEGALVSQSFVTELNQALDSLEATGYSAKEFRPSNEAMLGNRAFTEEPVIDGPYFRAKLDAAIHYLSGRRA
jgi:hypothetical protein